jgi:hypothetical protein
VAFPANMRDYLGCRESNYVVRRDDEAEIEKVKGKAGKGKKLLPDLIRGFHTIRSNEGA